MSVIVECNNKAWQYDIEGFSPKDATHIIAYCGKHRHHFSWHVDHADFPSENSARQYMVNRKLSFTIPLINSTEYEGGDFQTDGNSNTIDRLNVGDLLVFPSHVPHRVTPVTSGERKVLVGFIHGPPLR